MYDHLQSGGSPSVKWATWSHINTAYAMKFYVSFESKCQFESKKAFVFRKLKVIFFNLGKLE